MRMENGREHFAMNIVGWEYPELAQRGNFFDNWLMVHLDIQVGERDLILKEPLFQEKEWDSIIEALQTMIQRSFEMDPTDSLAPEEMKLSSEVMSLSFVKPYFLLDLEVVGEGHLATKWSFEYRFPLSEETVHLYFHKDLSAQEVNDVANEMTAQKNKLDVID